MPDTETVVDEDDDDKSVGSDEEEGRGFIIKGRRLLKPQRMTSVNSKGGIIGTSGEGE